MTTENAELVSSYFKVFDENFSQTGIYALSHLQAIKAISQVEHVDFKFALGLHNQLQKFTEECSKNNKNKILDDKQRMNIYKTILSICLAKTSKEDFQKTAIENSFVSSHCAYWLSRVNSTEEDVSNMREKYYSDDLKTENYNTAHELAVIFYKLTDKVERYHTIYNNLKLLMNYHLEINFPRPINIRNITG